MLANFVTRTCDIPASSSVLFACCGCGTGVASLTAAPQRRRAPAVLPLLLHGLFDSWYTSLTFVLSRAPGDDGAMSVFSVVSTVSIYSWTSPMIHFVMDETRNVDIYDEFHIGRVHEHFIMQLNNALKDFDTFFRELSQILVLFAL